jgi:hypothetical protein
MIERKISRQGWLVLTGVPALFFCAYMLALYPPILKAPLCAVKMFLGLDCPGCGITRSLVQLTHGHFRESVRMHPLGVFLALWLCYMFLREIAALIKGNPLPSLVSRKAKDILIVIVTSALIGQWLIKLLMMFAYH